MQISLSHHMSEKLIVIPHDAAIEDAFMKMKSRNIRHLLVANQKGQLVGLLSERDLLRNLNENEIFVESIMTKNLVSLDVEDNLEKAIDLMVTRKQSSVLVRKNETIVGIITSEDMLVLLQSMLRNEKNQPKFVDELLTFFETYGKKISDPNYV